MANYWVDPSSATNGAGTFADPRNIPPASVAYGDIVLFKEGTALSGGWSMPAPSGVGSDTNRVTIGSYSATNGGRLSSLFRQATINGVGSTDALRINYDYVTVDGLYLREARTTPAACVYVNNASYVTVQNCRINCGNYQIGGAYGIRFDNPTGAGTSRTKWRIVNNIVERTTGNGSIICAWGANAGEFVTDITITDNVVHGNPFAVPSTTNMGIRLLPRATSIDANRPGFCAKGVRIERNVVHHTHSYGYSIAAVIQGGTQSNVFRHNYAYEIGDGNTDAHCVWLACCEDWVVDDNVVDGSNAWVGQSIGSAVGIFIDKPYDAIDGSKRIKIRRNVIRSTGRGANLNLEVGGGGIAILLSSDIDIEANVIDSCSNGIVVIGWYGGVEGSQFNGTPSANINIRNNLVANSRSANYYAVKDARNVSLRNNISRGGKYGYALQTSGVLPVVTGYSESNNLVFGASIYSFMTSNEPEAVSPTQASRSAPANYLSSDPKLADPAAPWLGLKSGSPCWGSGAPIQGARDRFGRRFPNPSHIGPWAAIPR